MKQKDILLVVVVAIIAAVISILVSNLLISSPENRQQEVEVVQPIVPDFTLPDDKYFNENSTNPTQQIEIGGEGDPNQQPFQGQQN